MGNQELGLIAAVCLAACSVTAPPARDKPQGPSPLTPSGYTANEQETTSVGTPGKKPPEKDKYAIPADCNTQTAPAWAPCTDVSFQPDSGETSWRHWSTKALMALKPNPHHRGIDLLLTPDEQQLLVAKLTYGPFHDDIEDELVEVWVERSCGAWEKLGSTFTSEDGQYGEDDDGGRVYFLLAGGQRLAVGSYRVKILVKGDHTSADFLVHVRPQGTKLVVSDIDGTITTKEWDGLVAWFSENYPEPQEAATDLFAAYHAKGYYIVYLTARPEHITDHTREWFADNLFAEGAFHLSPSDIGELGSAAQEYKQAYLESLAAKGFVLAKVHGNKESDLKAYLGAGVTPSDITLIQGEYGGDLLGASMVEDYIAEAIKVGCQAPLSQP